MSDSTRPIYPEPQHFPEVVDFEEPATNSYAAPPLPEYVPIYSTPSAPLPAMPAYATPLAPPASATAPRPHVAHEFDRNALTCSRCGSSNLAKGYVVDFGDRFEAVHFAPKRVKLGWLNSLFTLRPWSRLLKLNAEACRDCGAVTLLVDPSDLRRAERDRD